MNRLRVLRLLSDRVPAGVASEQLPLVALLHSRLLPQVGSLLGIGSGRPTALHLEAALAVIRETQDVLRDYAVRLVGDAANLGIRVAPIKGTDSLLWGAGRLGRIHTRDIDLLLPVEQAEVFQTHLHTLGFRQYRSINLSTGETTEVDSAVRSGSGIEFHPWIRYEPAPHLAPYAGLIASLSTDRRYLNPALVIAGRVHIMVQVDVHHAVWPAVPMGDLELVPYAAGIRPCWRLMPGDNVVTTGSKAIRELLDADVPALGALFQSAWTCRRVGLSNTVLLERSEHLGVRQECELFLQVVTALDHFERTGDIRLLEAWAESHSDIDLGVHLTL